MLFGSFECRVFFSKFASLVSNDQKVSKMSIVCLNLKVFILPGVAELFIHKEKQRGCPLLGANRYTHIYISYICVYILFICLRL